jgi:hypothetical protein
VTKLPPQNIPPGLFPDITLGNGCAERFGERFDPGCQRFYRFLIRLHLLVFLRKHRGRQRRRGVPYLAIIQDKTETSCNGLEWTKGIRGFVDPTENQLGPRRYNGLEVRFVLIHRPWPDDGIRGSRDGVFRQVGNRSMSIKARRAVWITRRKAWSEISSGNKPPTYRWIPEDQRSSAKSKHRSAIVAWTQWDVERADELRWDFRPRSSPCFVFC